MVSTGDQIDAYKLTDQLFSTASATLFGAVRTDAHNDAVFVAYISALTLMTEDERQEFSRRVKAGILHKGSQALSIYDVGSIEDHPYLVFLHHTQIQPLLQEYLQAVDKLLEIPVMLHSGDRKLLINGFFQNGMA